MEKIKVEFCTGTACHLMGAHELKMFLMNNRSLADKIELSAKTCLGECGKGPNVKINGKLYSNMTVVKLDEIIYDLLKVAEED